MYENQVESALKNLNKAEQRVKRIEEAIATGKNQYGYNEYDRKRAANELKEAHERLDKWTKKMNAEAAKAASRNIFAIIEFLENWKSKVTEHYTSRFTSYYADAKQVKEAFRTVPKYDEPDHDTAYAKACELSKKFHNDCSREYIKGSYPKQYTYGKYYSLMGYVAGRTMEEATAKLEKELTQEANAKYDYLVERACFIVGTITDVAGLRVGLNGELNGIIVGDKGRCKIETIGAGGYNIQCYHFRVLVHEYKDIVKQPKSMPKQSKQPDDQRVNWSEKSTQELEEMAKAQGIIPKQYNNIAIYRMRLVMALKGGK